MRAGKPISNQFLYEQIFEAILETRLRPGAKLTEDELAGIFGVGRAVVRQALQRLSYQGVVELRPNRGAYVARPNARQAREVLEARRLIECDIIRRIAGHTSQRDLQSLRKLVAQEKKYIDQQQRGKVLRLSGDFHFRLAEIADNQTLRNILRTLIPATSLIIASFERRDAASCSIDEHLALVDAIEAGDRERACSLMAAHLHHVEEKLDLTEQPPSSDLRDVFDARRLSGSP